MIIKFIKVAVARDNLALSKTTFYERIKQGLIPPPISLGDRAVALPEHEIQEIIKARIAGLNNDEIKMLVCSMIAKRQECYEIKQMG